MKSILQHIITSKNRSLAILIDPDKFDINNTSQFIDNVNKSIASHIFIGGSTVDEYATEKLILAIKPLTKLPIVLFPGDVTQVTNQADAILFKAQAEAQGILEVLTKQAEGLDKIVQIS